MPRKRIALTPAMRSHLDNEMSQALALGRELTLPATNYPEPVRRSMRVAYASYYRTLLEFFHNGRSVLVQNGKSARQRDITVEDVLSPERALGVTPTAKERKRFRAADRLMAHLSRDRTRYHTAIHEWGSTQDQQAIRRRILALFGATPHAKTWFPLTDAELRTIE